MTPDRDLECAEYVLGLLDTEERSAVERALPVSYTHLTLPTIHLV